MSAPCGKESQHSATGRGARSPPERCRRTAGDVPSEPFRPPARPPSRTLKEPRMKKNTIIALVVAAAAAAGAVGGYLYRRHTRPTFEEKMEDASEDLKS